MKCPKCGVARSPSADCPEWQCPHCGVAYAKVGKQEPDATEPAEAEALVKRRKNVKQSKWVGATMLVLMLAGGYSVFALVVEAGRLSDKRQATAELERQKVPATSESVGIWCSDRITDLCRLLLDAGLPIDSMWFGRTPLHDAARRADAEHIISLLNAGASPATKSDGGGDALFYYLRSVSNREERNLSSDVVERLLSGGSSPETHPQSGTRTSLEYAASIGSIELVRNMLTRTSYDFIESRSHDLLMTSAGYPELIKLFLEMGLEADSFDHRGTPLMRPAYIRQLESLNALIDWGADPCRKEYIEGYPAKAGAIDLAIVSYALYTGVMTLKVLQDIDRGMPVDVSFLKSVIKNNDVAASIIERLLRAGCVPSRTSVRGRSLSDVMENHALPDLRSERLDRLLQPFL